MNPSGEPNRPNSGGAVREQSITFDALNTGIINGSLDADTASTAALIEAEERKAHEEQMTHQAALNHTRMVKFAIMGVVLLIGVGLVVLRHNVSLNNLNNSQTDASQRFPVTSIPLGSLTDNSPALAVQNAKSLSVNGQLNVNNSLVLAPTTQPNGAVTGQLYYNQQTNQISYYNGGSFESLLSGNDVVTTTLGGASGAIAAGTGLRVSGQTLSNSGVLSVGGATGALGAGRGISVAGGTVNNTGVLTLQGESGNVTLAGGSGIVVNGTTLSNSGLLSLGGQNGNIAVGDGLAIDSGTLHNTGIISATGAGLITVTNDGNGNITIDGPSGGGSGTGTVASPGGTIGKIAKFTGVQTIADSIISDNGTTVSIGGNLSVTGSITLGTPLSVANGGTGGNTQATARAGIGAAASGANSDITSLSGLTTALSVAQGGTGIGTLPTNGVLVGNGTSAISGITTATSGQCLVSTAGAPTFQTCPGSGGVASVNSLNGALTVTGVSGGSVSSAGSTITINDATNAVKGLASFNSANFSVVGGAVNTIQGIATTSTPTFGQLTLSSSQATGDMLTVNNTNGAASGNLLNLQLAGVSKLSVSAGGNLTLNGTVNGQTIGSTSSFTGNVNVAGTLGVNTITPTSSLTVGVGSQAFTLQGNNSSVIKASSGASATTIGFQAPTANVTYNFATAAAGAYDICTTVGNCAGVGGGVTTPGGSANTLAKFTGSGTIGNSIITDNGSTVTIGGTLSVNTLTPTGALTVGSSSQNLTLQGAAVSLKDTSAGITNSLVFAVPSSSNKTITLPNATGTVAVSASGPLSLDASGNLTCPTCLTGGGGGGAGVSSLNSQTGDITLQGTNASSITTVGTTITVNDATAAVKGLASFNATNLTVTAGNVNTVQNISVSSTPTFAGLNLSSALTVGNGGTGATTAAGARTNLGAAASGANSDITSLSGLTTALSVLQGGTGATSLTANGVLVGNGTSPVTSVTGTNGQCLMVVAGTPAFGTCPGGSGSVSSLDGLTGALTINNSTGAGSAITINNAAADGLTKGIATFNSTNFTAASGVVNTVQNINTGATPTFNGLNLSTALTVANGGTGLGVLTANQLLFANSTTTISQLANGSAGLCLMSNGAAVAPSFQTCAGAGGVSSIDSLTGSLTLANSSGVGSTITINNAAADGSTKGIATFNSTNFTAASGVVNTVQGIATTSTPSFAGLTLTTTPLGVSSGGTGLSTLTAFGLLYASSSSAVGQLSIGTSGQCLISNGPGLAPSWQTCPGSGGGITGSGTSGKLALFNGTSTLTSSDITDTAGTSLSIAAGVSLQAQGAATFENSADSTTAFQVQDHLANNLLAADTTNHKVNIGATGAAALSTTINIGTSTSASNAQTITVGSTIGSSATTLQGGTGSNAIGIQAGSGGTISIGTSVANPITIGFAGSTSALTLQGAGIKETLTGAGSNPSIVIKSSTASTGAFQVQNATSTVFNVDTSGKIVTINSTGTPLVLNMTASGNENGLLYETSGSPTAEIGVSGATSQIITQAAAGDLSIKSISGNILLAAGGTNAEVTIDTNGNTTFKNVTDSSTNSFQVQNASGINMISTNTTNKTVNIGATGTDVLASVVNIGTSSGTNQTVTVGSNVSSSQTTLQGGSGGVLISASSGNAISIGTSVSDNITIGYSGGTNPLVLQGNGITQTITGAVSNPSDIIKTSTNSSTAFQIQNTSGQSTFNVDTSSSLVTLGNKTAVAGQGLAGSLAFADGTNDNRLLTVNTSSLTNSWTLSLPSVGSTGAQCLQSTSGSTGSATVLTFASCGGAGSTSLQQAYTTSAGASPDIDMTSTNKGFTIQNDNSSPISGELFGVHDKTASGLGATLYSVANNGDITANSSETTGTGGAFALNANSVSSGNGLVVSANGLTTGNGVNIATTSALQTAGSLLNISNTATLTTNGGTVGGSLVNVSRSLTSNISGATVATPTLDTASSFSLVSGGGTTGTMTVGSNSNRFLFVTIVGQGSVSFGTAYGYPTAVSFNGVSMTEIGSAQTIAGPSLSTTTVTYWMLAAPATGAHSFTVTGSSHDDQGQAFNMVADSWYNVNQVTPYGTFSSNSGSGTSLSLTATSVTGHVVVDGVGTYNAGGSLTKGASQTLAARNSSGSSGLSVGSSYLTASGSTTPLSWTSGFTGPWGESAMDLIGAPSSSETVSSSVATFSNNCTENTGSVCSDASSVLSVNQQYLGATGAALNIQNSGQGFGMRIQNGGGSATALTVATTNLTGIDTTTSSVGAVLTVGLSGTASIAAEGSVSSNLGDYAEYFTQTTPGQLQPGDVVCVDVAGNAERCSASNSASSLTGVISTSPGFVGNNQVYDTSHPENYALVSMLGQVPVHVSDAKGAIHVGDMLTFDPSTGLAVKATGATMTIGEALQDFSGGTGTIQLYIHIGYYDPMGLQSDGVSNGYVLQGANATLNDLNISGTATINVLNVTGSATIANLTVTATLSTAGITINGHIVTAGATPTFTAGEAAGAGASTVVAGNDESGKITITLGSGFTAGEVAKVTFSQAYGAAPNVVLNAGDSNAARLQQYVTPSTTGFSINTATTNGLTTGQTYTFYYHVMQ